MTKIKSLWLGEQLIEVEFLSRFYAGSRWEPDWTESNVVGLYCNGRRVDANKYYKLADHVLMNGK